MPICAAPKATNVHASKALTFIKFTSLFLEKKVSQMCYTCEQMQKL